MTRFLFSVWQLWVSWCGAPSLTRGWVCNLLVQLLLGLARAVTLRTKSRRAQDHILLSHFRPSPSPLPTCLPSCCIAMIASAKLPSSLPMHYHGNEWMNEWMNIYIYVCMYICVCVCVCVRARACVRVTGGQRLIWQCPLHCDLHDLYYAFQIWVCSVILKKGHTEGYWKKRIENLMSCDMVFLRHSANHNFR
jgi:hypothetical protein